MRLVHAQTHPARERWRRDRQAALGGMPLDAAQIEQALINALRIAVEAAGDQETVTVRLARAGGHGVIEIEDSGLGITDEARAQLFTPFFTTKQNDQGIGLTFVHEILRRRAFAYALEDPAGSPTRFRITLGSAAD